MNTVVTALTGTAAQSKLLRKTPRPFQLVGAKHLASNWHAMLGDAPGTGKTFQSILAAEMGNAKHILVTTPASVRLGFLQEIEECIGHTRGWEVVSVDSAMKFSKNPTRDHYDVWIGDEIHTAKNFEAQRSQAIFHHEFGLATLADYKWPMSGTPIINRPRELFPVLCTLAADRIAPYDTFAKFAQRYCGAYFDGRGINTRGSSNLEELKEKLKGFLLRRTKQEVLPELPPRIITRVPLEIRKVDMQIVRDVENTISNREAYLSPVHEDYSQLGDLARLRRATGLAKVHALAHFIDELVETAEGKVVVFTWHRDVASQLAVELGSRGIGAVLYQGGMTEIEKREAVDTFIKNDNFTVFIGNIQAAGTGINGLQFVANDCIFGEVDWSPGTISQAIDRLDRMDKKFVGPVNVFVPFIPGSLENAMLGVYDGKMKVIDKLFGDEDFSLTQDPLEGLY